MVGRTVLPERITWQQREGLRIDGALCSGSMTVRRHQVARFSWVSLILVLLIVAGCDRIVEKVELHARVEPSQGHVPYAARIICTPLAGTYVYELPNDIIVESKTNTLDVIIDRLDWEAGIAWSDDGRVASAVVSAHGTNPAPRISRPCINGDPYRWYFTPHERTLIDFTPHLGTLSGPQTGVLYEGRWHIVSIQVECELKSLCGIPIQDSVFCPSYDGNEYHALWSGQVIENACIIYPLYTSETTPDGRPYAPTSEIGYAYDPSRAHDLFELMGQQNAILGDVAFPAQGAMIQVVVEDEWGRRTADSFNIPVRPLVYATYHQAWGSRTRFCFAEETSPYYHLVRSDSSRPYQLKTCPQGCATRLGNCLFFCREADAMAIGRQLCPLCAAQR